MKLRHFILILVVASMALFTQGCSGIWSYDFTKVHLGGWDYIESEYPGTKVLNSSGLVMSGVAARSHWGFKGDIVIEVIFELHNISTENRIDKFAVWLGDGQSTSVQSLYIEMTNIGGSIFENCVVKLNDAYKAAHIGVEGLQYNDINSLVISIQGGVCNVALNDTSLCTPFSIADYAGELFIPYLFVQQGNPSIGAEKITIKSVNVKSAESREYV